MTSPKQLFFLLTLLLAGAVISSAQTIAPAKIKIFDLDGKSAAPLMNVSAGTNAVVLIFARTDCPLSKRYTPEIKRLTEKFAAHKITVHLIFPGADEGAATIRQYLTDYKYQLTVWRDPEHLLAKATGVSITPEVAVLVPEKKDWRLVYRGRIDDRVAAFGKMRPAPTVRDLENVLTAITKGEKLKLQTTNAIGCYID